MATLYAGVRVYTHTPKRGHFEQVVNNDYRVYIVLFQFNPLFQTYNSFAVGCQHENLFIKYNKSYFIAVNISYNNNHDL